MKKITLLFAFVFAFVNQMNAQVFSENFDSGTDLATLGWTTIDNDGQTPAAQVSFVDAGWNNMDRAGATTPYGGPAGNFAAMSTSWYAPPGQSDDWLISPSIVLPAGSSSLVWEAKAQDPGFPDGYEVRISTTAGTTIADFPTVLFTVAAEAANAGNVYATHTVDLSAYAGQTVTLAWVNNSNDMFILVVDNISVVTCAPPTNLVASAITTTTADLTWNAVAGSTGYEYVLDTNAGDPVGAGTANVPTNYSASLLIPNTTYYFHVRNNCGAGSFSAWSTVSFLTLPVPPVNDECTGAISLTVGAVFASNPLSTTNIGATTNGVDSPSCQPNFANEVWYSFVVPTSGDVTIETQANAGMTDSVVAAFSGTCGALTEVGCDDDLGAGLMSKLALTGLTPGDTIHIGVWRYSLGTGVDGTFVISVYSTPLPPANNDCSGAIMLTPGGVFEDNPIATTNLGATTDGAITPSCQASFANDVWYSVVVPASGELTIETQTDGGMTDSVVAAFSGTCGNLTEIGCDDDSGLAGPNNFMSVLALTGLTPGDTIYIGVWKFSFLGGGTDGTFMLSAYDASLATDTFTSSNFTAYPNPVKNILNLSYDKTISNVAIFNLLGQEVTAKSINANQSQIDMSNLPIGTYMVKVTSNGEVKTIKVIKE